VLVVDLRAQDARGSSAETPNDTRGSGGCDPLDRTLTPACDRLDPCAGSRAPSLHCVFHEPTDGTPGRAVPLTEST